MGNFIKDEEAVEGLAGKFTSVQDSSGAAFSPVPCDLFSWLFLSSSHKPVCMPSCISVVLVFCWKKAGRPASSHLHRKQHRY